METLKEVNHRRNTMEQRLYDSNRNEELLALMRVQKSLVYFTTALRSNELLLMKMERTNFLNCDSDEREFLSDLIVEFSQALEMADNYSNILTSTMDAYASIINNNMNLVIKRLTSITIILTVPGTVAAFFGMNVVFPGENKIEGFYASLIISVVIAFAASYYFTKKKWF